MSDTLALTAARTSLPPRLDLLTMAPSLVGGFRELQVAASITPQHPYDLEAYALPINLSTDIKPDFTRDGLDANLTPEQAAELIKDFYRFIASMGSLIVINHGPGITPEIEALLQNQ